MAYLSLFITAFLAATLLPLSSEVVAAGLVYQGINLYGVWLVATFGNTLGSCVNWWLGGALLRFQDRRWFPVSPKQLARAQARFQRLGKASLLLAWVPIIGDPLTVIAGVMRVAFWPFVALVFIGKAARYAVVVYAASHVVG